MAKPAPILLGRITAAHGIRGEVLVHSFAAVPADIAAYGPLHDKAGTRAYSLKVVRDTGKGVICRIKGIADRNAAEALMGTELYVPREKLPAAAEDEYYHADLIGLAVFSPDDTEIGTVVGVHNFGAGDLIEVALKGLRQTELIPFSDAFVPTIDIASRRVIVIMPVSGDDGEREAERSAEPIEDSPPGRPRPKRRS